MQLINLLASEEDRAVSPVIGVILMVAITVILAAVIGAFVLGLGGDQEQAPQATLNLDCDGGDVADINHRGGDRIDVGEISTTQEVSDIDDEEDATVSTGQSFNSEIDGSASDDDVDFAGNSEITLVHDPSDSIILDRSC